MDRSWFFRERIRYIRFFYHTGVAAFRNQKRLIENELPPYDNPPYSENGEPPYLDEWIDADMSEDVLGRACVSMLSDALKVYLNSTREEDFGFEFVENNTLKRGFVRPHIQAFCCVLEVDLSNCPVNIELIEQIVLARNNIQHGSLLNSLNVDHDKRTLSRFPRPLFSKTDDLERDERLRCPWYSTKLTVTEAALKAALDECESLANWIGRAIWGTSWSGKR